MEDTEGAFAGAALLLLLLALILVGARVLGGWGCVVTAADLMDPISLEVSVESSL